MNKQKRNLILLSAAAVAAVAAIILFAVVHNTGRGGERATLEQFYKGLYTTDGGGMPTIIDAVLPALQDSYYDTITNGGTNFAQLAMWQSEANSMVGSDVRVSVKVLQVEADSATVLNGIRSEYGSDIEACHAVSFQLTLTGNVSTEDLVGVLPMARVDGRWYLMELDAGLMRVVYDEETAPAASAN